MSGEELHPPPPPGEEVQHWKAVALRAERRAVCAEDALRAHTGSLLGRVTTLDVEGGLSVSAPAWSTGAVSSIDLARRERLAAAKRQAMGHAQRLEASVRNYERIAGQSSRDAGKAAAKTLCKRKSREKDGMTKRAIDSDAWPRLTVPHADGRTHHPSPYHIVRSPVALLRAVPFHAPGGIADIEQAAREALGLRLGIAVKGVYAFGHPAYGNVTLRGAHELHMRPEVIADKVKHALAVLDPGLGAGHVDDMLVHVQVCGSKQGRAAAMYQRATEEWARRGGLLIFHIEAGSSTFDAIFVSASHLRRRPSEDAGHDVVRWILEQDDATVAFTLQYIAYYTQVMLGSGPEAATHLQDWVQAMEERAIMSTRLAGVPSAHEVYTRIASLVRAGPVPFPGLAPPPPPPNAPFVRVVYSKDGPVWKQGIGSSAAVIGRFIAGAAAGAASETPRIVGKSKGTSKGHSTGMGSHGAQE